MPESVRTVHRGRKFDLQVLTLPGRDGRPIEREVVRHPGAAVVLPLLESPPRVVMIRNRRPAVGRVLWELPAGTLEPPEPPEVCAARELEEEAGFRAATIVPLGRFYTTPGLTDELMWSFVATGLVEVGQRLEADEDLAVEVVSRSRALAMIDEGEIVDGKSIASILLAHRRGMLGA